MCYFNFNSNLIGYLKIFNQSECLKQASRNFTRENLFKGPQAFGVKIHSSVTILSRFSKRQISFRALVGQPLADKWVGLDLERWILFLQSHLLFRMKKVNPSAAAAVLISGFESPKFCIKIIEMVVIVVWTVWPDGFIIFNIWPRTT